MPTYPNGYIPRSALVLVGSGYTGDGYYEHLLPPATAARHRALVALGEQRNRRTLKITPGYNGFRPMAVQIVARERWGTGAALPGSSSHGGDWAGAPTRWIRVDTAAIDYSNWLYVFGSWDNFIAACREVGLMAGAIMPPDWPAEQWHVIDLNPYSAVPAFAWAAPLPTVRPVEEDEMLMLKIGGAHLAALGEGIFRHFTAADPHETIKNLARSADDWQNVSFADLPALLVTYGCDRNIWDVRDGKFVVLDPLSGTVAPGNMWSSTKSLRASIAGIKVPAIDPTPIVDAVRAAIDAKMSEVDGSTEVVVDEQAIARAVRDEFRANPLT